MSVINLSNNNLTRFESAVFLDILEQMNLPFAVGYIDIESSIYDNLKFINVIKVLELNLF